MQSPHSARGCTTSTRKMHSALALFLAALVLFPRHASTAGPRPGHVRARAKRLKTLGAAGVLRMTKTEKRRLARTQTGRDLLDRAARRFTPRAVALNPRFLRQHDPSYRHQTKLRRKWSHEVRDQWSTGRCWLFAFESWMQSLLAKKGIHVEKLSVNFLNYHSLRKRVNAALMHLAKVEDPSAELHSIVRQRGWTAVVDEGGFFDWALDIVKTHGIVRESDMWGNDDMGSLMPSASADDTGVLIQQLQMLVDHAAQELDQAPKRAGRALTGQRKAIVERYRMRAKRLLDRSLGEPPKKITVEIPGGGEETVTPKQYMKKHLKITDADMDVITLANDAAYGEPNRLVAPQEYSALGMKELRFYHVPMDVVERAVQRAIRTDQAVWVAANASFQASPYYIEAATEDQYGGGARARSVLSISAFDYEPLDGVPPITKDRATQSNIGFPVEHAMTVVAYDPGRGPARTKYQVLNSWGREAEDDGVLHYYGDAFAHYMGLFVVARNSVPKKLRKEIESKGLIRREFRLKPDAAMGRD